MARICDTYKPCANDERPVRNQALGSLAVALALLFSNVACTDKPLQASEAPTTETPTSEVPAPIELATVEPAAAITWFHDDYDAALAAAKTQRKPLVVDLWAPWCHTCISMQKTVLTREAITQHANRFIWLALDTDKPKNAPALKNISIPAWPTFYVLSPAEQTLARHVGGASTEEFEALLKDGLAAQAGIFQKDSVGALAMKADKVSAGGDHAAAAKAYRTALKKAGPLAADRFALRVDLLAALKKSGDLAGCLQLGDEVMADQGKATSAAAADFVAYLVSCANKSKDEALLQKTLQSAVGEQSALLAVLKNPQADLSADDRSDANRILREAYDALNEPAKAKLVALEQKKILDQAIKNSDDPELIAGYAWPREEVYVYLGQGEALVGEFKRSVKALPESYDPPYRLAWLLNKIGRSDEAKLYAEDAIKKVYGPRTIRAWQLLAAIEKQRKDNDGERVAWAGLLKTSGTLAAGPKRTAASAQAKENLARLAQR